MNHNRILWILTRSPMHVGAGASVGVIDMPIQRERHTQIPIVPGSGLKGVLRDLWDKKTESAEQDRLFGPENSSDQDARAGELVVGEARTICFPVRSAKGSFAWLTSPLTLARVARERAIPFSIPFLDTIDDEHCLAGAEVMIRNGSEEQVVLEEYCFKANALPEEAVRLLADAFAEDPVWETLPKRLVIVSDGIFSHFCANACEVQQRIRINDDTGTVEKRGLFNQENLPSESLMMAAISERDSGCDVVNILASRLEQVGNLIQLGGDETIGLGYCGVRLAEAARAEG